MSLWVTLGRTPRICQRSGCRLLHLKIVLEEGSEGENYFCRREYTVSFKRMEICTSLLLPSPFSPFPCLSEEKGTPDIGKKAKIVTGQCLLGNSIPLKEILSLVFSTRL